MASKNSKELIEEFIEIYRSEPCIWDVKSAEYSHRPRKAAAYARLLEILKQSEPNATKEAVMKKINTLRSNFRKELRKVNESKKSGGGIEGLYKPTLWYYDLLSFLDGQCTPRPSVDTMGDVDSDNTPGNEIGIQDEVGDVNRDAEGSETQVVIPSASTQTEGTSAQTTVYKRPPKRKGTSNGDEALKRELLMNISQHFRQPQLPEDRFDAFGKNVTMKLRDLPKQQRVIAEKLINDVLSEAEMNNLDVTYRITSDNLHRPSFSVPFSSSYWQQSAIQPTVILPSQTSTDYASPLASPVNSSDTGSIT